MVTQPARELEAVFRAHHARVLQAAYRVTGSMADAEDVAQSVFLRLARGDIASRRITHLESYLRSEEHTSELQSQSNLVCRLLLEKQKNNTSSQHSADD